MHINEQRDTTRQHILFVLRTFKLRRNFPIVGVYFAKLATTMSKRLKMTPRQVLDEIFADEDSNFDPDVEDLRAES